MLWHWILSATVISYEVYFRYCSLQLPLLAIDEINRQLKSFLTLKLRLKPNPVKCYFPWFVNLYLLEMVAVCVLSTAVDTVKEQMPKMLFLFLSVQDGAPFVNLLFSSLLVVFFVICSFIYDNFITDCPFSQRSNITIIGYLITRFLYLSVI